MKFADKLISLRKHKGISQEELATMLNVSRQAVSRWEMGSTLPDINNVIKLSDIFCVSIDSLIRDERTLDNKKFSLLEKIPNTGDVAFIASPLLIYLGLYLRDDYSFGFINKIGNLLGIVCIVLGIVSFGLVFYFYNQQK